jgi:hypothetical protein
VVGVSGCATWQAPAQVDTQSLKARAVTAKARDVQVSAAVLSTDDSKRMFGADINATGVQPVWVEVENGSQNVLWLLRSGSDPDYFSPLEVAWSVHQKFAKETNARIDEHFASQAFVNPIPVGATRSGVLFTNPQPRTQVLNIDLLGNRDLVPFTLFLPVPDDGGRVTSLVHTYDGIDVPDYTDEAALRAALEKLPCCAVDASGGAKGEPLNLVLIGRFEDLAAGLVRRGFRPDRQPIDEQQQVFGRPADAVSRKYAQGGASAAWIRVWLAPIRYEGKPVFVAQVGRPIGGRFANPESGVLMLHPDVDEARNLLLQDVAYSGGLAQVALVQGVGTAPIASPRSALEGASYHTDGLRLVLFLALRPLGLEDIQLLDWEPYVDVESAMPRPARVISRSGDNPLGQE